ncbi:dihydrofolate reductase [Fulvivirga sp. RKSG066]|uniref:dihydrofolate reductase family protein n=1 Tax=Fulvivirga aurantia TaxID=2529383 RepID=UPI0012BB970E|nr:dihydrofolate reductase family protein [Fulvivirga aurantia]MTI21837.1 dihydrofolate reductase [Fulvivirga aurantia]
MRKLISYMAMSIDGKIARLDGDVKWLDKIPNPDKTDYGYGDFYKSIDTTLMGRTTYEHVKSFGFDYYKDTRNYVFSSKKSENQKYLHFISEDAVDFTKKLKTQEGKNIWLIGGGKLNASMLKAGLIDELMLFVMPIVLGEGIAAFEGLDLMHDAKLIDTKNYNNSVTYLHYTL